MSEINKAILLCFKDYDDLFRYRREIMNHLERYCEGFNTALPLNVELIEDKKSAIMCPMCFTPFEK